MQEPANGHPPVASGKLETQGLQINPRREPINTYDLRQPDAHIDALRDRFAGLRTGVVHSITEVFLPARDQARTASIIANGGSASSGASVDCALWHPPMDGIAPSEQGGTPELARKLVLGGRSA